MATTTDTVTLNDEERSAHHVIVEAGHHSVDIAQAEAAFDELSRRLSKSSHAYDIAQTKDLEQGDENDEVFDLRDYLTSSNDANEQAGIKHKHVGVTWEDLQVDAIGGADSKVS
jgi:ATP-binding cassette subfamily G (WHITE) protein 2 (SNQ2)